MMIVTVAFAVSGVGLVLSVTRSVIAMPLAVVAAVGVPNILPSSNKMDSPEGSGVHTTAQEYGAVPPLAVGVSIAGELELTPTVATPTVGPPITGPCPNKETVVREKNVRVKGTRFIIIVLPVHLLQYTLFRFVSSISM